MEGVECMVWEVSPGPGGRLQARCRALDLVVEGDDIAELRELIAEAGVQPSAPADVERRQRMVVLAA